MNEKLTQIKAWLGTSSINIFGLPFSGKDTVGRKLAELLNAEFLSSGDILRNSEAAKTTAQGELTPTDEFERIVLPYFAKPELAEKPLFLSSIGRWSGEEYSVMQALQQANHPLQAVIVLNISENSVRERWQAAKILEDRADRTDDKSEEILNTRLSEFNSKTLPVISHYQQLELLIAVNGDQPRPDVINEVVEKLAARATGSVGLD
ncbi:nucleoside monophosphate kinase [Candidatus Saccharibacteria bacterium]|nr:nucleoside monophosphate kinase [Candidatus Saccharibacteria bacterium]